MFFIMQIFNTLYWHNLYDCLQNLYATARGLPGLPMGGAGEIVPIYILHTRKNELFFIKVFGFCF